MSRNPEHPDLDPTGEWESRIWTEHPEAGAATTDDRAEGDIAAYAAWRRNPNRITADSLSRPDLATADVDEEPKP